MTSPGKPLGLAVLGEVTCAGQAALRVQPECTYCHRPLSDPESISRGYGPDCAADRGLPHGRLPAVRGGGVDGQDVLPFSVASGTGHRGAGAR